MKKNYLHKFIGTGSGLGLIPFAPGTFGSLGGLLTGWIILEYSESPTIFLLSLIIIFFFLGVYCSNKLIPEWGKDPSRIVIDEVVGMWISMLFLPHNIGLLIAAFGCFRLFDIFKPLGIRKFESFPRGWGIMLDDVVAGFFANAVIQLFLILKMQFI